MPLFCFYLKPVLFPSSLICSPRRFILDSFFLSQDPGSGNGPFCISAPWRGTRIFFFPMVFFFSFVSAFLIGLFFSFFSDFSLFLTLFFFCVTSDIFPCSPFFLF